MKIRRYVAKKVHGHIDFDIKFNPFLTLLVGINGSGKTTVVRTLSALIAPSLISLAYIDYERIEVEIQQKRKRIRISSTKDKERLILSSSETEEELEIQLFPEREEVYRPPRFEDRQLEYYREMENQKANHPVMQFIRSLPSPMLLGIERRGRELFAPEERTPYVGSGYTRRGVGRARNIFGNTLFNSLVEAEELTDIRFGEIQRQQMLATQELRENMLLTSLRYEEYRRVEKHSFSEIFSRVIDSEKQVISTLMELGLPPQQVTSQVTPFFTNLKGLAELLKDEADILQLLQSDQDDKRSAAIDWILNYPQYTRMNAVSDVVSKYITKRQKFNEPVDRYFSLVNRFLEDSGKEITFHFREHLRVKVKGSESIPVTSLSSGESQIVVIITHLMFNPAAQQENVFIVDEPELSLHVGWQELFVDAIKEANPRLQLILATHSPSIILDKTDNCFDLSK